MDTITTSAPKPSSTKPKKRGRKAVPHVTADDVHINGLRRRKNDGRWVVVATGQMFTEPDESKAIAKFRRLMATHSQKMVHVDAVIEPTPDLIVEHKGSKHAAALTMLRRPSGGFNVTAIDYDKPTDVVIAGYSINPLVLWPWLREMLLNRPEYLAEMTGVSEVARLADLPKRRPSPSLDAIGQAYFDHATVTERERSVSRLWWSEFCRVVKVTTLREVTAELVTTFHDHVMKQGLGAVAIGHKFAKVKTVINFAKKCGLDATDCRQALDACAVLVRPQKNPVDPKPIERDDFHAMLNAANPKMKAAMLMALNACMYGAEVSDLKWRDIRGDVLMTIRNKSKHVSKTPVRRAAVLWPDTLKALNEVAAAVEDRDPDAPVFGLEADTIREHWQNMRVKAKVSGDVKFNMIRDGAYTAAVEGDGVDFARAQVLAGHRSGIADAYVARRPKMVQKACEAVRAYYFD